MGLIIMTRLEPHCSRLQKAFAEPSKQIEPMASFDDAFDGAHDLDSPPRLIIGRRGNQLRSGGDDKAMILSSYGLPTPVKSRTRPVKC
jgi:hypothetical protein